VIIKITEDLINILLIVKNDLKRINIEFTKEISLGKDNA
jgi:hypothetical protein